MTRAVFVHGFSQTPESWAPVLEALRWKREVRCPPLPGHASASERRDDFDGAVERLAMRAGEAPADFVGYSMGGRLCLAVALRFPERVRRLVLLGAQPGIESEAEREARIELDEERARELEHQGVEAFLERWLRLPLFATLSPEQAGLDARVRAHTAAGLAHALRALGPGRQPDFWPELPGLRPPTLFLAGELDARYRDIAVRAAALAADARAEIIPGAGHAAHLEAPAAVAAQIAAWLD